MQKALALKEAKQAADRIMVSLKGWRITPAEHQSLLNHIDAVRSQLICQVEPEEIGD